MQLEDRVDNRVEEKLVRPPRGLSNVQPAVESATTVAHRPDSAVVFDLDGVEVYYGEFRAVSRVNMKIFKNEITAFIGPSGCGKTTVLRSFNRMHDVTPGARVVGGLRYRGAELYGPNVSATEVRRRIG